MFDRDRGRTTRRPARRPQAEALESRHLLVATLAPLANISIPQGLGFQVPLDGGTGRPQAYTVSVTPTGSSLQASVARGQFLTLGVSHASSGPGDPAFSGTLTFQLFEDLTPLTAARIEQLVNQGFYTAPTTNPNPGSLPGGANFPSKNFHRIAANFPNPTDFIVQGGSVNGNGTGEVNQPGFPFDDEFLLPLAFTGTGQLAMANAGDDTNSSQFFITTGSPRFLDFNHTIFGQLVDGQATLTQMTQVARNSDDAPLAPILITTATLSPISPDGVIHLDASATTAGQLATVTVTATDPADNTTATQSFQVAVEANTINERAFLGPIGNQVAGPGSTATFTLPAVNLEPTDTLTYIVRGGITNGQFTPVLNATATVNQTTGVVSVTPTDPTFTGTIDLVVGVRDQVNRAGAGAPADAVANFDTQRITLTVTNNTAPTADAIAVTTRRNVATPIQLTGNAQDAGQSLTFTAVTQPASGTISNFNAQAGTLTYTPRANFTGTDTFTYRVRDVGQPTPNLDSNTATVTITVMGGDVINLPPTARDGIVSVVANTPAPVQLQADTGNPESPGQTLVYTIVTNPANGTIADFNAQAGTLTYQPAPNFIGTDTLTFRVRDVGEPTLLADGTSGNLDSAVATVTFTVAGDVATGAVRVIDGVLVITPPPRTRRDRGTNTIDVQFVNGQIAVAVNGVVDVVRTEPSSASASAALPDVDRIVAYGAKASDRIVVAPNVPVPVTLDGGHGGTNELTANDLPARLHGWFGRRNTLTGGAAPDALIGRRGRVRFRIGAGLASEEEDTVFAGDPRLLPRVDDGQIVPPTGTFFRFARNNRLVALPTPPPRITFQSTRVSRLRDEIISGITPPDDTADPADPEAQASRARTRANRRRGNS